LPDRSTGTLLSTCRYKFGDRGHVESRAARHSARFVARESALKRPRSVQYSIDVLSHRAVIAAVAIVSLSVGFYAGNRRASALERYLDQLVLEHEGLRAVMAEQSYHLDRLTDSRAVEGNDEVERLRVQLEQAALSLSEIRSVSEARQKDVEARDEALGQCGTVQAKLEQALERCIFDKATLERGAASDAAADDLRPRSGTSEVRRSVTYPVPVDEAPPP